MEKMKKRKEKKKRGWDMKQRTNKLLEKNIVGAH